MKIFLDDIRDAPDSSWHVARSVLDAVYFFWQAQSRGWNVTLISLDHDLGEGPTGYDLMKWFEERAFKGLAVPLAYEIHSANPVGRKNMEAAIQAIEKFRS